MNRFRSLLFCIILIGCNKEVIFDGANSYNDGFESYSDIKDLLSENDENWSFFQSTLSENRISLDTSVVHTGDTSVKFIASRTQEILSKASINKQNMAFWDGETVSIDFWLYLEGNESVEWLFIFDLEEQAAIGAGPGMRLALVDGRILLEHKFNNPNVEQEGDGILFPRDQWVNITFETKLSQKRTGYVKVYQDGTLIIDQKNWKTLPSDFLYSTQGTQGRYSQIEFGITANPSENDLVMYVDDISVQVIN